MKNYDEGYSSGSSDKSKSEWENNVECVENSVQPISPLGKLIKLFFDEYMRVSALLASAERNVGTQKG